MDALTVVLALFACSTFFLLSMWHVRMAFGVMGGESGAVPSVPGKPLFVPSRGSTLAVAAVLLLFAVLVAATAGAVQVGVPRQFLAWLSYALATGLLARAIGELRYVGFFKRVRGSRFARLDTLVYSPLCLTLAVAVAALASRS
jgi:hypothetical protein